MKKNYYFQYNLPADNHIDGATDYYIDVKAERLSNSSHIYVIPLVEKIDLRVVKDWRKVLNDIEKIGEEHFKNLLEQEKIEEARKTLSLYENPILDRGNAKPLGTIVINDKGFATTIN